MNHRRTLRLASILGLGLCSACGGGGDGAPSFRLAWSEYPSWSTFGVAHELGLLDGDEGEQGAIEKRWNVDVVLDELDYDPCITGYASGAVDAVCITNMDVLNPSLGRASVAILPTSTSKGADACLVVGDIASAADLAGKTVYGLEKSVSEYCFVRNLEIAGVDPSGVTFANRDPGAAALSMQQGDPDCEAIMVWNPFVLDTLEKRKEARVLFDSSAIPGEIVDMVVVARSSLGKDGGDRFACALVDAFYAVAKRIDDAATRSDTLLALGQKFSNLGLESMTKVVEQTDFYETPALGVALFEGPELRTVMQRVVTFCKEQEMLDEPIEPDYGDSGSAPLRFDPTYMKKVAAPQ